MSLAVGKRGAWAVLAEPVDVLQACACVPFAAPSLEFEDMPAIQDVCWRLARCLSNVPLVIKAAGHWKSTDQAEFQSLLSEGGRFSNDARSTVQYHCHVMAVVCLLTLAFSRPASRPALLSAATLHALCHRRIPVPHKAAVSYSSSNNALPIAISIELVKSPQLACWVDSLRQHCAPTLLAGNMQSVVQVSNAPDVGQVSMQAQDAPEALNQSPVECSVQVGGQGNSGGGESMAPPLAGCLSPEISVQADGQGLSGGEGSMAASPADCLFAEVLTLEDSLARILPSPDSLQDLRNLPSPHFSSCESEEQHNDHDEIAVPISGEDTAIPHHHDSPDEPADEPGVHDQVQQPANASAAADTSSIEGTLNAQRSAEGRTLRPRNNRLDYTGPARCSPLYICT